MFIVNTVSNQILQRNLDSVNYGILKSTSLTFPKLQTNKLTNQLTIEKFKRFQPNVHINLLRAELKLWKPTKR